MIVQPDSSSDSQEISQERLEKCSSNSDAASSKNSHLTQISDQKFEVQLVNSKNNHSIQLISESHPQHAPLDLSTEIQQFKRYGPSIYLLFALLKKSIVLFAVLATLSLVLIFYNFAVGETFPTKASGVAIAFARASLGAFYSGSNVEQRTKKLYSVLIAMIIVSFFSFWLYWKAFLAKQCAKIQKELNLPNYSTVVLQGKAVSTASNQDIRTYMSQFGQVKEVVGVENKGEVISILLHLTKLEKSLQTQQKDSKTENIVVLNQTKIRNEIQKFERQFQAQIGRIKSQNKSILRYFVTLDSQQHASCAIETLKQNSKCCGSNQIEDSQSYLLNHQKVQMSYCNSQPWGIYWENQHVGFKERILPNLVLFLLINALPMAIIIILGLVSAMASPVYYHPFLSSNNYSESQIIKSSNSTEIESWCIGNHYSQAMENTCKPILDLLSYRTAIYFAIAFCLGLSQYLMKLTILGFEKYLRFKDYAERSQTVMIHLLMNYTVIYVVIALSVQSNLLGAAMSSIMAGFIKFQPISSRLAALNQYYDYIPEWYADYGFQLILNYIVIILFPYAFLPLVHFSIRKFKRILAHSRGEEEIVQLSKTQLQDFQVEDHYANTFTAVIVGMVFAVGLPILFPLILAALIVRFFSLKYLFIYVNRPPRLTNSHLASTTSAILFVAILCFTINGIWALGVEQVFSPTYAVFDSFGITMDSNAHNIKEVFLVFLRRLINNFSTLFFFTLCLVLVFMRKKLANTWLKILRILGFRERNDRHSEIQLHFESPADSEIRENQRSYNPRSQKNYREVFLKLDKNLEERQRD